MNHGMSPKNSNINNVVVQTIQVHKRGAMSPSVLRCRILAPYVPLRATMQRKCALLMNLYSLYNYVIDV